MDPKISLGNDSLTSILRAAREAAGLSQEAAGEMAGTTGQSVYDWERGKGAEAWEKRLAYLRLLAGRSPEARRLVFRLLGIDATPEMLDPQVNTLLGLLLEARTRPGWDHLYFAIQAMTEGARLQAGDIP